MSNNFVKGFFAKVCIGNMCVHLSHKHHFDQVLNSASRNVVQNVSS
jgi:hypothetical protein